MDEAERLRTTFEALQLRHLRAMANEPNLEGAILRLALKAASNAALAEVQGSEAMKFAGKLGDLTGEIADLKAQLAPTPPTPKLEAVPPVNAEGG